MIFRAGCGTGAGDGSVRVDDGLMMRLAGADGFAFETFQVRPAPGTRRGGVVVCAEVFGLNSDIRRVAAQYASLGYEALAPALFDRLAPGFAMEHVGANVQKAVDLARRTGLDQPMGDIAACVEALRVHGPVFIVGYCYGGTLAWSAACRVPGLSAAAVYYGSIEEMLARHVPLCPVIAHFGAEDPFIPRPRVEAFARAQPGVAVHVYPAGHGFNSRTSPSYDAPSAERALARTLALFMENGGVRQHDLDEDD